MQMANTVRFLSRCGTKLLIPVTSLKDIKVVGKYVVIDSDSISSSVLHDKENDTPTEPDNIINFETPCGSKLLMPVTSIRTIELFGRRLIIDGNSTHSTLSYQTSEDAYNAYSKYRLTLFNGTKL